MEKLLGTVFLFLELETGEKKKMWTNNGITWFTKIMVPVLDEDFCETDEVEENDLAISYEVFIMKYKPLEARAIEFTKWCLKRVCEELDMKSQLLKDYCNELS